MVAQFHDWLTIHEYADAIFKLGVWYNSAPVVVELTGGLGRAVVERLKTDLCYWNIYRQAAHGEDARWNQDSRFGVDTTAYNKASMIALLQELIKKERFICRCSDTLTELSAYAQERTDAGLVKYRGASGSRDDRVMSLAIGVCTIITGNLYNAAADLAQAEDQRPKNENDELWAKLRKDLHLREDPDAWLD